MEQSIFTLVPTFSFPPQIVPVLCSVLFWFFQHEFNNERLQYLLKKNYTSIKKDHVNASKGEITQAYTSLPTT